MRSNAIKDLEVAKKAGIYKATEQFTQKNEMAREVSGGRLKGGDLGIVGPVE